MFRILFISKFGKIVVNIEFPNITSESNLVTAEEEEATYLTNICEYVVEQTTTKRT